LCVLWVAAGIDPKDVYAELTAREGRSGLDDKAARKGIVR
jgi:phosphoribosyl-ATP pyrophosphohydrolase